MRLFLTKFSEKPLWSIAVLIFVLQAWAIASESPSFWRWLNYQGDSYLFPQEASAVGQYTATGGSLSVGTDVAAAVNDINSWRATMGNDGNFWTSARTTTGLSKLVYVDGVKPQGANKMIITIEDSNVTTGNTYEHLICDWATSTDVYLAADSDCTGGGWRSLNPIRTTYTNTTDTNRVYEIYDGYFWSTSNVAVATPLTNFIDSTSGRVLIRTYSTVNSLVQHRTDWVQVEMAIDPIYEPAGFATTSAGTITNGIRHLIGAVSTNVNGSDNTRMTIPMPAINQPVDMYFSFANVNTYEGMNSILISPEFCVSNTALTFAFYLYNFANSSWDIGTATTTGTACTTDTDYAFAMNGANIPGFDIDNYISGGELRLRFLTAAPGVVYNAQFDRLYIMLGSVNSDTSLCEITWGTGTAANCANTRTIGEAVTATPASTTWQVTSAVEYQAGQHPTDNDDDTTGSEHAYSANITFPASVPHQATVTGIHYAMKHRSNITSLTIDPQLRNYGSMTGVGGMTSGAGWFATPGSDSNALTTYGYFDTWRLAELQNDAHKYVNTHKGQMNMRLRTNTSTNTTTPTTWDWSFAMVSFRYLLANRTTTVTAAFPPTGGLLETGTAEAASDSVINSWRATVGNDTNYWRVVRTPSGFSQLFYIDDVKLLGANKLIITLEDHNVAVATNYENLICDWVSNSGVYLAADSNCTGGGWRTLHPRGSLFTDTSVRTRVYEIYDGYFWNSSNELIDTPLSNFISTSTGRVLLRSYSTVNSANTFETDWVQVEPAIDPFYEPAGFATTSAGAITNGIKNLIGPASTVGVTATDGSKMTIPMPAINQPVDMYFSFKNVKPYEGTNTVLIVPEVCATNAALTFAFYLYNFVTDSWEKGMATTTPTVCATDTTYAFSMNSVNMAGFDIDNYLENGELRLRFLTAAPGTVYNAQFDRLYIMLGSVNSDNSLCEITWGSGTVANCENTRFIGESITATPASTTWQITGAIEYQSGQHASDNDDDATGGEYAKAANISFPITMATGTMLTAIHHAQKFRSNETTVTWDTQLRNYSTLTGVGGETAGGAWANTPGTDTNLATTYSYYDSWQVVELQNAPDDFVDYSNNRMNMRLRTSASTNVTSGVAGDWSFAMMSVRYVEAPSTQQLTFSISDSTVGFGSLSALSARFATGDTTGSASVASAHTMTVMTNAASGYALSLSGTTLTCCGGVGEITAIGDSATTSQPGIPQFGLSLEANEGSGTVASPYNGSTTLFAFATSSFPDTLATGLGSGLNDLYTARYLANISANTEAGDYSAVVTYTVTSTY